MKLRLFSVLFICCIAIAWPHLVVAQQPTNRVARIGFLLPGSREAYKVLRVGILVNADNPAHERRFTEIRQAASVLHIDAVKITAPSSGLDQAFAKVVQDDIGALMVLSDGMFLTDRRDIVERVAKVRVLALYQIREFVFDGGLMSYGVNIGANYHRSATYVDRILKGAKAADLAIERPARLELVINLKTAKALGRGMLSL
jgi:ABC-type uncharacterized transport system substrate-binding protein